MKKLTLILLICSISLNLFSQEIDFGKVHEDTKSENVLTGVILKIGANTFLNSGTPNYLKDKAYDMYDYNYADPIKLNSNQGISTFDNNSELTEIEYSKCYGVNSSIGYKTKLLKKLYFSIEGCYNYTRRKTSWSNHYVSARSTNSISMPIAILFRLNKRLNFEIGVNVRYNFYKTRLMPDYYPYMLVGDDNFDVQSWIERPDFLSKSSLSPLIGLNYNITENVFVNARYYFGDEVLFSDYDGKGSYGTYNFFPARSVLNQLQFSIGFNLN
jgi:hypothetical protein